MPWTIDRDAAHEDLDRMIDFILDQPVPEANVEQILTDNGLDDDMRGHLLDMLYGVHLAVGIASVIGHHFTRHGDEYVVSD